MAFRCSKQTAVTLFCLLRQAERSVHFLLSSPSEWPQFKAFYDMRKQSQLSEMIGKLRDAGVATDDARRGRLLVNDGFLSAAKCAVRLLCNPLKRSWAFSMQEASFFAATFEYLVKILQNPNPPQKDEFIERRLDCFDCHWIIARKLMGLPELRKADSIEHFNQSEYREHVTFHDMGIHDP